MIALEGMWVPMAWLSKVQMALATYPAQVCFFRSVVDASLRFTPRSLCCMHRSSNLPFTQRRRRLLDQYDTPFWCLFGSTFSELSFLRHVILAHLWSLSASLSRRFIIPDSRNTRSACLNQLFFTFIHSPRDRDSLIEVWWTPAVAFTSSFLPTFPRHHRHLL